MPVCPPTALRDNVTTHGALGGDWQRHAAAHTRRAVVRCAADGKIDAVLLRAVVDPLVENAIRHTAEADPVIVDLERRDNDLFARVSNLGTGVPTDLRDQLFQPWTGRAQGGLGLWLAREAARAAGGDVWCEDPGPPNTTFIAQLPLTVPEPAPVGDPDGQP